MATMGARRFAANTAPTAVPSSPAKRPKIETSPPRTKAAASQRWCRCVTRSVSKGTSTGLRTWRVDTQRFRMWKYPTIFGLEAMSPTPTARPETETTRNNMIKNWTSSCHVKLLYVPMFPPILYAQSSRACRTASTPHGALEALRNLRQAEPQAFVVHRDARPKDEVVDHLRDLPGPRRPQMEDVRGKRGEDGSAELEGIGVARAVDEELARRRGRFPARERNVEKNEIFLGETSREPRRVSRRDRRTERDDESRPRALEHALLAEESLFDFALETDQDN